MQSEFTCNPPDVPPTETSWKDNIDWKEEYEKKWDGDKKLALPPRSVKVRYPRVPDFNDPDFDRENPEAYFRARDQRHRERFVALAEMQQLQDQLRICFAKSPVNAPRLCRPLAFEYMRRLKCPLYICDHQARPVLVSNENMNYASINAKVKPFVHLQEQPIQP